MKKILLLLIKYIPVIQMAGILLNNILYYFDTGRKLSYCIDFFTGSSIITTFLLYITSYVFKFCKWHRIIITGNFVNLTIANIDAIVGIDISDISLLIIYHFVAIVFIDIAIITYLNNER